MSSADSFPFDMFSERGELVDDLARLATLSPAERTAIIGTWRAQPDWLDTVRRDLGQVGSEDPDGAPARAQLAALRVIADEVVRTDGRGDAWLDLAWDVIATALRAGHEGDAAAFDVACTVADEAAMAARAHAGAASERAIAAALVIASVRASFGTWEIAALERAVQAAPTDRLRKRALADLGVAHLAALRVDEAFAAWRQMSAIPVAMALGMDLGPWPEGDAIARAIHQARQALQIDIAPEYTATWGPGGPTLLGALYAIADELEARGHAGATRVRAEADAAVERALAAWDDNTEAIAEDLLDLLEAGGRSRDAARIRALVAAQRP